MSEIVRIRTISDAHRFFGLEKPKHPLVSIFELTDEIINFDFGDCKYVCDFYQINLKQGFSGSFKYGRNTYDFEEGTLIFIKPGQTIEVEGETNVEEAKGWTLLFHPDLLRTSELGRTIGSYSFFDYSLNEALHLSDMERQSLAEIIDKIRLEYNQNIDKHSQELIIANLDMLLKYCKRYYDRQFYTRANLNSDILDSFEKVVKAYYDSSEPGRRGALSVKHCAQELNMSVNYLSDLLKSETGKSAKSHIQDYVVESAKNRLLSTTESISEIAYDYGFEYPQGFNKLFKAKVGMSPSQYRSQN